MGVWAFLLARHAHAPPLALAHMTIVSYNVNGIRAALLKGLAEWMARGDYDIVCLQEVKAMEDQVDLTAIAALGYAWAWHAAEKKGYSGVATFWKVGRLSPKLVTAGCGIGAYDCEGRILRTDFEDFTLLNCYFPSGSSAEERQDVKMRFLADFTPYLAGIRNQQANVIVVGDYNIAHNEIDIHNPKANAKSSGFLPEERAWMTEYVGGGMVDAYRYLNPEAQGYTWWSFRGGARTQDKGWRIDYQMVSAPMQARLMKAYHLKDELHSDHCAVVVEYGE